VTDIFRATQFQSAVPTASVADLNLRLRQARLPMPSDEDGWQNGTSLSFMRRLVDHWLDNFDWPAEEARLNRLPHFMARITLCFLPFGDYGAR
jgi:hypothetical protein